MSKDYTDPNVDDVAEERKKDSPMDVKKEAGRTKAVFKAYSCDLAVMDDHG